MIRRNWILKLSFAMLAGMALTQQGEAATVYVTGGDVGEGLNLDSSLVVGAIDMNTLGAQTLQGVNFSTNAGIFSIAGGGGFAGPVSLGASADDDALEAIASGGLYDGSAIDVTIGLLTPGETYTLDLIQSLTETFQSREQAILVNGVLQELVQLNIGISNVAVTSFTAIANISGELLIGFRPSGAYGGTGVQDGALINGMVISQLEQESGPAVPEPSTYALGLMGLAGLGLVAWRRRGA